MRGELFKKEMTEGLGPRSENGFSLLEVIIVISLMALVYTVALPNLNMRTGVETATKMGQLATDIRSAFDMAVLKRKNYRIVFNLVSSEYWLETTESERFYLGNEKLDRDLTKDEEKDLIENFDEDFEEYVELAGQEVEDSENERTVPPVSPVVSAKDKLKPVEWKPVENQEWGVRSLGPYLIIQDFMAEHHGQKQTAEELGESARAILYFFPSGYVEKAVIHIAVRKGDNQIDETELPFTLTTNSYTGTADVVSGYEEVDIAEAKK